MLFLKHKKKATKEEVTTLSRESSKDIEETIEPEQVVTRVKELLDANMTEHVAVYKKSRAQNGLLEVMLVGYQTYHFYTKELNESILASLNSLLLEKGFSSHASTEETEFYTKSYTK